MKAVILVGGYGTRLRPLTFSCPKPLVPFLNVPIVTHQIEALVRVGVKEVILAVNVQPDTMREFLTSCEQKYGIKIHISIETEPMGTAGPLALARDLLLAGVKEGERQPFFMFNSDVSCDYPLQEMLDFHNKSGGDGTILVTRVQDPSKSVLFDCQLSARSLCVQIWSRCQRREGTCGSICGEAKHLRLGPHQCRHLLARCVRCEPRSNASNFN